MSVDSPEEQNVGLWTSWLCSAGSRAIRETAGRIRTPTEEKQKQYMLNVTHTVWFVSYYYHREIVPRIFKMHI